MDDCLIVDAHQDLAWNMLTFGRDYSRSALETRRLEQGSLAPQVNGDTLLGWPEYQAGRVAMVFASLFATPQRRKSGDWDRLCYLSGEEAYELYRAQVSAYQRLVDQHPEKFTLIAEREELVPLLAHWSNPELAEHPVGLVISMEGAEAVRQPDDLEEWWEAGVRLIAPAWSGNRYCGGTHEPGGLTRHGFALLDRMAELGFILDLSHMDEKAALQALDTYPGQVVATHSNAQRLLKSDSNRHLSDRVILGLIERGGVIGVVPFNNFLKTDWNRREEITLQHLVAQIEYLCEMAGDALHVGLGSDFDGGFGVQSVPAEIDTIADLRKLIPVLEERGYSGQDIACILGENWIGQLEGALG